MKKNIMAMLFAALLPLYAGAVSLEECYSLARENYPLIRQYDLVRNLEKFNFANAATGYMPQIQFSGQATWQTDVVEFPEEMTKLYEMAGLQMKGLSRDQYKFMLQISQTIWDGGATRARREDAKADGEVSRLNVEKEMEALKSRVNQIYFGILALQENLETIGSSEELLRQNLAVAESGEKNGVMMRSDIDRIRVELLSLQQKRTELSKGLELYRNVLGLMTGREFGDEENFETPAVPDIDRTMNKRIELSLFDAQTTQALSQKRMVNSSVMPHFDVFAQGWYGKPGLNMFNDMMYNKFSWNAIVGVRMVWNISSFYTRKNSIRIIENRASMLQNQKDVFKWNMSQQQMQIEKEVEKMEELQASDREIADLRRSIRETSESKYRNGVITVSDLLHDITEENSAERQCRIRSLDALRNIYDLKVLLGQ